MQHACNTQATRKQHAPPGCLPPAACGGAQLEQLKATTEAKEVSFKIAYGLPLPEMVKWGLYISEPHRRARGAGVAADCNLGACALPTGGGATGGRQGLPSRALRCRAVRSARYPQDCGKPSIGRPALLQAVA
jgi:hypothetical protein